MALQDLLIQPRGVVVKSSLKSSMGRQFISAFGAEDPGSNPGGAMSKAKRTDRSENPKFSLSGGGYNIY